MAVVKGTLGGIVITKDGSVCPLCGAKDSLIVAAPSPVVWGKCSKCQYRLVDARVEVP